ncbi:MAG: cytochrome c oxidase subunit 3 [Bacteroidetes bacterium]|nr:cytochrome c oxidase subunit 3 [Bacteroidota bacterium]
MALTRTNNSGEKPLIKNPAIIVVNFLLVGIVVLFLAFSYGYFAFKNEDWIAFRLPRVFWLSTLFIILVSVLLRKTVHFYDKDNALKLRIHVGIALIFATAFVVCQWIGWQQLHSRNLHLDTSTSVSYIYLLTGLHAIHVLVGMVFLITAFFRVYKHTGSQVNALIYFSDPIRRSRFKMLATYWHTIDLLWVYLFLAFLYNHT